MYFFDPNVNFSKFTYPGMADYGNAGRNTFRGPHFFNVDASLVKTFALTERKKVFFRAEAYNLLNNVNFGNPSFSLTNASELRQDQQRRQQSAPPARRAPLRVVGQTSGSVPLLCSSARPENPRAGHNSAGEALCLAGHYD